MVLKVFFWGMLVTPIAAIVEIALSYLLGAWSGPEPWKTLMWNFLGIAFIEEYAKYFVIRWKVLRNKEFDEPIDSMIYLVIAALGFAAFENVLILIAPLITNYLSNIIGQMEPVIDFGITQAVRLIVVRFWGATLLHTLASAVLGFFLALSFYHKGRFKYLLFPFGMVLATLLHGLFNYFILLIEAAGPAESFILAYISALIFLLIFAAIGVNKFFKVLKSKWAIKEIDIK